MLKRSVSVVVVRLLLQVVDVVKYLKHIIVTVVKIVDLRLIIPLQHSLLTLLIQTHGSHTYMIRLVKRVM